MTAAREHADKGIPVAGIPGQFILEHSVTS